jgi:hypothetical protein
MSDFGHWKIQCEPMGVPRYGFIYIVTNLQTGMKYIGNKQMYAVRKRPPLKGKTKKRTCVVETDWKYYTSSSPQVNKDIETYGIDAFTFEIVRWCNSKSELAYYEAKEQFDHDVLLNDNYYNGIINLRISKIKCTPYQALNLLSQESSSPKK